MNPLYDFVSELKNRIAKGEISGYTALDLFYQHVTSPSAITSTEYIPEPPPVDDAYVLEGCEKFSQNYDPVPEPASEEPADGQTAVADSD